ncbi:nucleoside diphosphate kinase 7 isoform X2 [Bombyx mori]|uniref:DM10 domain-containing protein n=1 Tax=Bombyx mori TaxID=7091 RepID=A0A8R2DNS5_BOMMO|nr:nucleoside diphosphate kinase 7 isoform X2 [Bombyx mori]
MVYDYFDKYSFLCEMYDEDADEIKDLTLNYFPFDNSVQIIDAKKGKNVLKRVQLPPLNLDMLQIGNIVNIFSKLLYIKDCAPATRKTLFKNVQRIIIDYVTTGEVIGLELVAPDAVTKWRQCLGATDPTEAAPGTLRNLYGENKLKNVAHGCNTSEDAAKMLELFFGYEKGIPRVPFRATFKNCTCCVIKPHAVIEGNIGSILEQISTSGKFFISAMAMFSVKLANATEFFEVYKGVLPEYEAMCIHLAEGKCVVLEVTSTNLELNSVCEFRKMCGPRDPDLCRQLYPESIRALYGKSIVHNAVHCTDLPEDGELEVEYFFKLVAND